MSGHQMRSCLAPIKECIRVWGKCMCRSRCSLLAAAPLNLLLYTPSLISFYRACQMHCQGLSCFVHLTLNGQMCTSNPWKSCSSACMLVCPLHVLCSNACNRVVSSACALYSELWGQSVDDIIAHVEEEMVSHDPATSIQRSLFHGCHITILTVQAESASVESPCSTAESLQEDGRLLTATRQLLEKVSKGRDTVMQAQATCLELQVHPDAHACNHTLLYCQGRCKECTSNIAQQASVLLCVRCIVRQVLKIFLRLF